MQNAQPPYQPSHPPCLVPYFCGAPLTAAFAGPQFSCGFIWYRTSLTLSRRTDDTFGCGASETVCLRDG